MYDSLWWIITSISAYSILTDRYINVWLALKIICFIVSVTFTLVKYFTVAMTTLTEMIAKGVKILMKNDGEKAKEIDEMKEMLEQLKEKEKEKEKEREREKITIKSMRKSNNFLN